MVQKLEMSLELYRDIEKVSSEYSRRSVIFLAEPDRSKALIEIIEDLIKKDEKEDACHFANMLPEPERSNELYKILEVCVVAGQVREANSVVKNYLHRELSVGELQTLLKAHLNGEWDKSTSAAIIEQILESFEIAKEDKTEE